MTLGEFFEIVVCVLAVYGVYALVCRVVAAFCSKERLAVGVLVSEGPDGTDRIGEALRYAEILCEEHKGAWNPPVLLLPGEADSDRLAVLRGYGYDVYCRAVCQGGGIPIDRKGTGNSQRHG